MRKHDVRKWLHAILDLLPVILIPVFMIYSHRHTIDSYQVEYAQNEVVDFNQQFQLTNFYTNGYGTINYNNDNVLIVTPDSENNGAWRIEYQINLDNHLYLINYKYLCAFSTTQNLATNVTSLTTYTNVADVEKHVQILFNGESVNIIRFYYDTSTNLTSGVDVIFKYLELFDLTQMFGAGNEPTIEQFNSYFSNDYYDYTTSKKVLLKDVDTITYNDTDIGSQMLYCLYNSVDKYFNFNNVFNFNQIYDWFVLNIFNGNAPLIAPIIWNIILYEFIMDVLFLTYAVFMFVIDFTEHFMESCFNRTYRGGTRK